MPLLDRFRIPPTIPAGPQNQAQRADQSRGLPAADHIVIPVGSLSSATPARFKVDASYLHFVLDWPVSVKADGRQLYPVKPARRESPFIANPYEAQELQWFNSTRRAIRQPLEFEVFRDVEWLEFSPVPNAIVRENEAGGGVAGLWEILGQVHVYIGREGVCNVGPGPWEYAGTIKALQAPGATAVVGPFDFCLHQRLTTFGVGTTSGQQYHPSEVELLDVGFRNSTGCPTNRFALFYRNATAGQDYILWSQVHWGLFDAIQTGWRLPNIRVPNWMAQPHAIGPFGMEGVYAQIFYGTTCQLDDVVVHLNFRGR